MNSLLLCFSSRHTVDGMCVQWNAMIEEHTKQNHTVCVLEGIKQRREFMTSVAGLKRHVRSSASFLHAHSPALY